MREPATDDSLKTGEKMIKLEDICFSYNGITALDHVSYEFVKGKCYMLQGPNGCGKSTLFRIINALEFPDTGRYLLNGDEVTEKKMKKSEYAKELHKKIGFIFQNSETQLFCRSVEDEIAFGLWQSGLSEEEVHERTEKYISLLQLEAVRSRVPFSLSGGEKKRTALAAVFAMEPLIFIMDEPMSGLDEEGQKFVSDFIRDMCTDDRMMIVATHDREFADNIADVKLFMNRDHRIIS